MTFTTTVAVNLLPLPTLQHALRSVGYTRSDIAVCVADNTQIAFGGGTGIRGFAVLMPDVSASGFSTLWGSWGGPSIHSSANPVDNEREPREVPERGAIITGWSGGGKPARARIFVRAATYLTRFPIDASNPSLVVARDAALTGRTDVVTALLSEASKAPDSDLSELDRRVLGVFRTLKSFARPEALARIADGESLYQRPAVGLEAVEASVERLVSRKYLKRALNGATSVTTAGKNVKVISP